MSNASLRAPYRHCSDTGCHINLAAWFESYLAHVRTPFLTVGLGLVVVSRRNCCVCKFMPESFAP
jgi:hypothetical protein